MRFILEGPDGAGKTTLAKQLCAAVPSAKYLHAGPPAGEPLAEYELPLQDDFTSDFVIDRWHWGEMIYGPIVRGGSGLTELQFRHVEMFLESRGFYVLLLTASRQTLAERYDGEFVTLEQVYQAQKMYTHLNRQARISRIELREGDNLDTCIALARGQRVLPFTSYIGSKHPTVLYVGDRKSDSTRGHSACFAPYKGTSGEYLFQALSLMNEPGVWVNIAMVNAHDDNLVDVIATVNPRRVVALGTNASAACVLANVSHSVVPHPSFVKRFHHKKQMQYVDALHRASWSTVNLIKEFI